MDYYQKNLEILEKYYPGMKHSIKKTINEEQRIVITEEISSDGERILKIFQKEKSWYLAGKRNAKQPPHDWFLEQGEIPENYTYIFMGIGNIGYLRELIENVNVHLNIIIYEPSVEIFKRALQQIDLEQGMLKHLIIFWIEGVGNMTLDKMDFLIDKIMKLDRIDNVQLFVLPNYDLIFKDLFEKLLKKCEEIALNQRVAYNTAVGFAKITTLNVLKNSKYLCSGYKTIQLFETIPMDTTGIVVAAGPSLNKNINELKKAKGKSFIIAVDTALKPLLRAGIVPDMFFIVDAQKPIELVQMDGAEKIPMVTTLNATPEILDYHKGKKFFFDESYVFAEKIILKSGLRWGDVATGGSVATDAFSLLYKIGLKTIILVGQDLALTGNKTHADGTFEEKMPEIDTKDYEWVEGNIEEKVPTRTDFHVFLNWYVRSIKECKEHVEGFRVINATEGGAKIEGTEVMTLKDAIKQTCTKKVDIKKCLDTLSPMLNEKNRLWAEKELINIPEKFKKLKEDTQKLQKSYEKIEQLCKKQKMDSQQYLKLLKKIKNQIERVERYDVYQLVGLVMPSATLILRREENRRLSDIRDEGLEIARKGKLYTKLVCETAELLKKESETIFSDLKQKVESNQQ